MQKLSFSIKSIEVFCIEVAEIYMNYKELSDHLFIDIFNFECKVNS